MTNALTIDVEEWFHICGLKDGPVSRDVQGYESRVERNVDVVLSILKEKNIRATFFILGFVAERHPELVRKIDSCGHEIATHGSNHQLLYDMSGEDFRSDLQNSIRLLKGITGKEVLGFRAPSFSVTDRSMWALAILKECGIKYDCSIFPVTHPRYGIKDAQRFVHQTKEGIIEFPLSTVRVMGMNLAVAGGAYLRILPYSFIKYSIRRLNKMGHPAQVYLHSWEIDPAQPRIRIPWMRRFTHYVNLERTEAKFRALLTDFDFAPVKEVLGIARA